MDDLISRQAAIDALHIHLMYRMGTDSNKKRLDEWINNLPSAQPTIRPRADWIRHDDPEEGTYYECGCCGVRWALDSGTLKDNEVNYCPKCGAVVRTDPT